MKRHLFVLLVLLIPSKISLAQTSLKYNLTLDIGYMVRSTSLNGMPQNPKLPFIYERNIQGSGLNFGFKGYLYKINLGLEYNANVRYDYIGISDPKKPPIYKFLYDNNINIFRYIKPKGSIKKKWYYSVGYNVLNTGAELHYYESDENKVLALEFDAWSISLGIPVWKIYIEPKAYFVDGSFNYYPGKKFGMLGLRVYYSYIVFNESK